MSRLDFWFEFASTYSYLSAMRIETLAAEAGVTVVWRPFLLGPIFKAQGWSTSPFNLYPAKGRYMVRDIERIAADRGLAFRMPPTFPVNGLLAARLATVGVAEGWVAHFTRAAYEAQFARGRDIADPAVLADLLADLGLDPQAVLATAASDPTKTALRAATEEAIRLGVFGAPSFVTEDGEIFWGDDRLRRALAWAQTRRDDTDRSPS